MTIEIKDEDVIAKKLSIWPNELIDLKINGTSLRMVPKDHIQTCEECRLYDTPVCDIFSCYVGVYKAQGVNNDGECN